MTEALYMRSAGTVTQASFTLLGVAVGQEVERVIC